jgi:hypothetical protein
MALPDARITGQLRMPSAVLTGCAAQHPGMWT